MPSFNTSRSLRHSAQNMYDLVANVEAYPEFVPLCKTLHVRSRDTDGDKTVLLADMTVAYKMLRETFTSKVILDPKDFKIDTEAVAGPFRHMQNIWQFSPTGEETCSVIFSLTYDFRSRAIQLLVGGLFDRAFRKYATAFEERADTIYGHKKAAI